MTSCLGFGSTYVESRNPTEILIAFFNFTVVGTVHVWSVAYPGILFEGGEVQQIQLRTEDREDGDLGAVAA